MVVVGAAHEAALWRRLACQLHSGDRYNKTLHLAH